MGAFRSRPTAEIYLYPTDKPFYWSGETVSGIVVLQSKKYDSVRSLEVICAGQLFYQVVESDGGGSTTVIDVHRTFFIANQDLASSMVNSVDDSVSYPFRVRHSSTIKLSMYALI